MPNHPNRNWRQLMHERAQQHASLYRAPSDAVAALLTVEQVRELIARSYADGYAEGRASNVRERKQNKPGAQHVRQT